jgi:hypothetical protein
MKLGHAKPILDGGFFEKSGDVWSREACPAGRVSGEQDRAKARKL